MKTITPSKAIRLYCFECSHYVRNEMRNCPRKQCPLFNHRRSKRPPADELLITPCKAIRNNCLDCQGDSAFEVKKCTSPRCALYHFRFGKNPNFHKTGKQRENSIKNLGIALPHTECQEPHQSLSEIKISPENPMVSGKEE